MKFLCPSCKAKYQIADEKVVGRTVKMKCRQCGHFIEINEAVTGNVGHSEGPPPKVLDLGVAPSQADKPADKRESNKTNLNRPEARVPDLTSEPARPADAGASARAPTKPTRGPAPAENVRKPSTKLNSPAARSPLPVRPERTRTPGVNVPRPTNAARSTTGQAGITTTPAPRKPAKAVINDAPEAESKSGEQPETSGASSSPPTALPGGGRTSGRKGDTGVTSATRLPGVPESVATSLSAAAPKTVAGLPKDALAGAFAKAVSEVPERAQLSEHPLAGDEWYIGINDVPIGPIRLAEIRDRAAKGEVNQDCLVWRDGFEDWKPLSVFPELVAVVEEGMASLRSQVSASAAAEVPRHEPPAAVLLARVHPESALQSAAAAVQAAPVILDEEALAAAGLPKQRIPLTAWLAVAAALVFGVTLGLVFIPNEPPKQVIKYIEVPASAKQAGPTDNGAASPKGEGTPSNEQPVVAQKQNGAGARKVSGASAESPAAAPSSSELTQGLKGLQGLQAGGPRSAPASEVGAQSGARQQLDSATLSRTVSRYTASVKRSCWQPALDARAPDAATSARISANIVVAPSGKVQNVTVSPDPKGYRGLSSCIQARVRNWEFPPAGGPTEFNVPFVFAAQ
ncbi:MAG TPA: GYF domain-containing protein [Polyangiaceae bacterium]|nr:GYF domain-containing protein [Polyangiaceae bacterium]